jgi:hypothetical protein
MVRLLKDGAVVILSVGEDTIFHSIRRRPITDCLSLKPTSELSLNKIWKVLVERHTVCVPSLVKTAAPALRTHLRLQVFREQVIGMLHMPSATPIAEVTVDPQRLMALRDLLTTHVPPRGDLFVRREMVVVGVCSDLEHCFYIRYTDGSLTHKLCHLQRVLECDSVILVVVLGEGGGIRRPVGLSLRILSLLFLPTIRQLPLRARH